MRFALDRSPFHTLQQVPLSLVSLACRLGVAVLVAINLNPGAAGQPSAQNP